MARARRGGARARGAAPAERERFATDNLYRHNWLAFSTSARAAPRLAARLLQLHPVRMGRNTHGAKHRKRNAPLPEQAEADVAQQEHAAAAAAAEDDDDGDPYGGADPVEAAATAADGTPADARLIASYREQRRAEKKEKRRLRLAAEAAAAAEAVAAGLEPPVRCERRVLSRRSRIVRLKRHWRSHTCADAC